jgi:hypothetical protein
MEKRNVKPEYIKPIMDALFKLGSATEEELLEQTFQEVQCRLFPADLIVLPNGEPRWRNQAQHMLDGLIESGAVLKENGVLRLSENQRP